MDDHTIGADETSRDDESGRAQLTEALLAAERFHVLYENAPLLIDAFDADGQCTLWNAECARVLGYSLADIREHPDPLRLFYPDPEFRRRARRSIERGDGRFRLYQVQANDGSVRAQRWADFSLPSGGRISIGFDVTEELEVERQLQQSETRLRAVVEDVPALLCRFQPDGTITFVNGAYCEYFGTSPEELVGKDFFRFIPPEHRQEARQHLAALRPSGPVRSLEHPVVARDGQTRWQRWIDRALFDEAGDVVEFQSLGFDVTDRRADREALSASEQRYRALVDAVPDLIFRIHRDGTYLDYVSGSRMGTYVPPNRIVGTKVHDGLPRAIADPAMQTVERALERGEEQSFEYALEDGGEMRSFEARVVPAGADEVLSLVRDVTQQRRLEARLRDSQKLEALGQLTAGISHDFNNLLTAVLGNLDYLSSELPEDASCRSALQDAHEAALSGARLIRKLLAFGRREMLTLSPVKLDRALHDLVPTLRRLLPETIDVRVALEADEAYVMADATALDQVVLNLATNARDAMPRGGRLRLATARVVLQADHPAVKAGCEVGEYTCIAVQDDGLGMDEATREHVFDPFFTTKPPSQGSGLGLAIVFGLVRQHRGFVDLSSEPGLGTTVEVLLPLTAPPPAAEALESAPPASRGRGETILFVEDEAAIRRTARRALERAGYTVIEAADGRQALDLYRSQRYRVDLVVSDVVMPEMTGPELYAAVRAEGDDIPFLFTSGYTDFDVRARTGLDPSLLLFPKPWTPSQLLERVRQALARPG